MGDVGALESIAGMSLAVSRGEAENLQAHASGHCALTQCGGGLWCAPPNLACGSVWEGIMSL